MEDHTPQSGEDPLTHALRQNIEVLEQRRRREISEDTAGARLATTISCFTGSLRFVLFHLALFGLWIAWNARLIPGLTPFDRDFNLLSMTASVEAIFLSTFVLMSQNRISAAESKRAALDLQVSLLTEHELTRLARVIGAIAEKLDVHPDYTNDLAELQRHVPPEAVLDEIEARSAPLA